MKILHICMNAPFTEHYSYQDNLLTEYQHKHGHDVMIVTTTRTRDANGKIITVAPEKKALDNGTVLWRVKPSGKLCSMLGWYPKLYNVMEEYAPDMIFVHGLCSFIPRQAIRYKKAHPETCIVADNHQDLRNTKVTGFPFGWILALHRHGWKRWIRHVDRVYGTTGWRKTFAREYYGIPDDKLDVLILGVDSDKHPDNPAEVRRDLRRELGYSEENFVFVTGGKLSEYRRVTTSMRAFSRLENKNARFLIFGSVAEEIREEFFDLLNSDNRISYIGYIDSQAVRRYFLASDFGLFPGYHSVLWEEAVGSGLPCLFLRYEENDHVEVCNNCLCVRDVEEEGMLRVMQQMAENGEVYQVMKQNAEKAAATFSYHAIAEKSIECCTRT